MRACKPNRKKLALVKHIIDVETRTGCKSIRKLNEVSQKYTEDGKKVSRNTFRSYEEYLPDIIVKGGRGQKGHQIISKKNDEALQGFDKAKEGLLDYLEAVFKLYREGKATISRAGKLVVVDPHSGVTREYDISKYPVVLATGIGRPKDYFGAFTEGETEEEKLEKGREVWEQIKRLRNKREEKART